MKLQDLDLSGLVEYAFELLSEEKVYPLQYSCLENSHSPWGRQELDTTEWLSLSLSKRLCLHQRKVHVYVLSHFSCLTLCSLMDYGMPSSSDHGILPSRILEWVAMHSSRGSSWPRIELCLLPLLHWQSGFTTSPTWEAHQRKKKKKKKKVQWLKRKVCASVHAQSCLTFHNPMDCSLPDSSVHEILQARTLEWVAISFSNATA